MQATQPLRKNHSLIYKLTLETAMRPAAAHQAIDMYLQDVGFSPRSADTDEWHYERGTPLASWYHPNPKRQQTRIHIRARGKSSGETALELEMRVSLRGNIPTQKDYDFWQAELRGIQQTFHFAYADTTLSDYAAERAMWYTITLYFGGLLLFFMLISLCLLTISALIAYHG